MIKDKASKLSVNIIIFTSFLLLGAASILFYLQLTGNEKIQQPVPTQSKQQLEYVGFSDDFQNGKLDDKWWLVKKSGNSKYEFSNGRLVIRQVGSVEDKFQMESTTVFKKDFKMSSDFDLGDFDGGQVTFGMFDSASDPKNGFMFNVQTGKQTSKIYAKTLLDGNEKVIGGEEVSNTVVYNL